MSRTKTQQAGGTIRSNIDRMRELTKSVSTLNDKIREQRKNGASGVHPNGANGGATQKH